MPRIFQYQGRAETPLPPSAPVPTVDRWIARYTDRPRRYARARADAGCDAGFFVFTPTPTPPPGPGISYTPCCEVTLEAPHADVTLEYPSADVLLETPYAEVKIVKC